MKLHRITRLGLIALLVTALRLDRSAQAQSDTTSGSAAPAAATPTTSSSVSGTPGAAVTTGGESGTRVGGMLGAAGSASEVSTKVAGFGYDAFGGNAGAIIQGPIDEQYLLSPGDEIVVSIWGDMNEKYNLVVSEGGYLELPNEGGRIQANGVTLRELRPMLVNALSQIYSAYINAKDPLKSTANVDVRLGQIRPMLIYVVGEVEKPGAYADSAAVANVVNLLHNAGGVRQTGSLREIKIRRSDGTIDTVDLYDFFLRGRIDYKKIRLQPGDYVIVPLKKKTVSMKGEVRRRSRRGGISRCVAKSADRWRWPGCLCLRADPLRPPTAAVQQCHLDTTCRGWHRWRSRSADGGRTRQRGSLCPGRFTRPPCLLNQKRR